MNAFEYARAQTFDGAADLYHDAKSSAYLAGGVDLMGQMKDTLTAPERVINLRSIGKSATIERKDGSWILGPNVTIAAMEAHKELGKRLAAVSEASRHVGSPQIRNMGTLGGNLAQHSRCWYYRQKDVQCLKNGGELCYASIGDSRYHCLYTNCECISPSVSNLAVALMALDARVTVLTAEGAEEWTIEQLYAEAWNDPGVHNSLQPGQLITGIIIPDEGRRSHYLQQSDKAEFDWALVSAAASARIEDGRLRAPRLVLGCIAPGPFQMKEVNELLDGQRLTDALADKAAERLLENAAPTEANRYKVPLARALAKRSLLHLAS